LLDASGSPDLTIVRLVDPGREHPVGLLFSTIAQAEHRIMAAAKQHPAFHLSVSKWFAVLALGAIVIGAGLAFAT
jgi:hypothetical protein